MKKKPRNIKLGEIVVGKGIVTNVDLTSNDPFWGCPNMTYIDYNDSYWGRCSQKINVDKKYKIITENQKIIKIYREVDAGLIKHIKNLQEEIALLKEFGYEKD